MFSVDVEGINEALRMFDQVAREAPRAMGTALYKEGERIMDDSKTNYVPVKTGALRASGHVEGPEVTSASIEVQLGFGGSAIPYAIRQHEELSYHHTVGTAKYLERPALAAVNGMAERIGRDVASELK